MIESHNPLFEGADPFLMTYQGKYYIYATNSPDGFRVYVSDDLVVWKDKGYCLKKGEVIGQNRFGQPEVIAHKGKFYMVYARKKLWLLRLQKIRWVRSHKRTRNG